MRSYQGDSDRVKQLFALGAGFRLDLIHNGVEAFDGYRWFSHSTMSKSSDHLLCPRRSKHLRVFRCGDCCRCIETENNARTLWQLVQLVDVTNKKVNQLDCPSAHAS